MRNYVSYSTLSPLDETTVHLMSSWVNLLVTPRCPSSASSCMGWFCFETYYLCSAEAQACSAHHEALPARDAHRTSAALSRHICPPCTYASRGKGAYALPLVLAASETNFSPRAAQAARDLCNSIQGIQACTGDYLRLRSTNPKTSHRCTVALNSQAFFVNSEVQVPPAEVGHRCCCS